MIVTRMNYDGAWRIGYEFRLTPDGRLSFEQSTSAGEVRSVESVGAITRGTWTKVTATRRNGVIAFYIGSTAQTLRTSSNTSSDGNLGRSSRTPNARTLIGARDDGYLFNGDIDEVVVHARALSATEVAAVPAAATYLPAVTYAYDANGNNTRVIDGRGNSWLATYNTWNLVQDRIEPSTTGQTGILNRRFVTTYDAGGLPVRDELPGISTHVVVDRVFDNIGNMTSEQSVANTDAAEATRTFSYDQIGRTTTMSHPTSTANMAWNDRNQLVAVTGPSSLASSFTYDARGRMTARLDAAGTTSYSWDGSNRLKTEADPLTNSTRTYSWLADNRVSGVVYGAAGSAVSRSYTYDGQRRELRNRRHHCSHRHQHPHYPCPTTRHRPRRTRHATLRCDLGLQQPRTVHRRRAGDTDYRKHLLHHPLSSWTTPALQTGESTRYIHDGLPDRHSPMDTQQHDRYRPNI
jgi:YD repeat-containing protein